MGWFRKSNKQTEHEYVEERLSPYLDGQLPSQERAVVERHLAACPDCQWSLDTLRQTVQWTRELPTVAVPRVFTIPAPAQPERAPRRSWTLPLLQGATALVAVLLFFVVAGDYILTSTMTGAELDTLSTWEEAAPAVEATQVVLEMEAPPAADEAVEAAAEAAVEEALPQPTPSAEPQALMVTVQVEKEAEVIVAETPGDGTMGAMGFEPPAGEAKEGAVETEVVEEAPAEPAEAPRVAAPQEAVTETSVVTATVEPAPTPLPTPLPTVTLTPAPTTVAEIREPAPVPARQEIQGTLREPLVTWIGVTEIVLAVAFILLATTTVVLMIRRRRAT